MRVSDIKEGGVFRVCLSAERVRWRGMGRVHVADPVHVL